MKNRIAMFLAILGATMIMGIATASYALTGSGGVGTLTNGPTERRITWGQLKMLYMPPGDIPDNKNGG